MANNCIHHWLIDRSDVGTCRKCGAIRDFRKLQHLSKVSNPAVIKASEGGKRNRGRLRKK